MSVTVSHTHYYVEIPAWAERWALRLGFTVMSESHDVTDMDPEDVKRILRPDKPIGLT